MKSISTIKPESPFIIENMHDGKCDIVFFCNVEDKDSLFEMDVYRLTTTFRPSLHKTIENNLEQWVEHAKTLEETEENVVVKEEVSEDLLDNTEEMVEMLHRMMLMEVSIVKMKNQRMVAHYDLSPYKKMKMLIENKRFNITYMVSLLDDFVNNGYMTDVEYSELYDLCDSYYNTL